MSASTERPTAQAVTGLSFLGKLTLLARVWWTALQVQLALRRKPLHEVVAELGCPTSRPAVPVALLSRAVSRGLRIGAWQPRCLIRSLVLYRLLRAQGDQAELVIGLHERATSPDAHAWIELGGRDVGPLPGRGAHRELSRYPRVP